MILSFILDLIAAVACAADGHKPASPSGNLKTATCIRCGCDADTMFGADTLAAARQSEREAMAEIKAQIEAHQRNGQQVVLVGDDTAEDYDSELN
jgi:hypothetical protein